MLGKLKKSIVSFEHWDDKVTSGKNQEEHENMEKTMSQMELVKNNSWV